MAKRFLINNINNPELDVFEDYWSPNQLENVFFCPVEAIIDRKIYKFFCSRLLLNLHEKLRKSKLEPVFIVTSTSKYHSKYLNDVFNQKFVRDFPHLSFLINSNILLYFIDIPTGQRNVKEYVEKIVNNYGNDYKLYPCYGRFGNNISEYIYLNLNIQLINELSKNYSSTGAHGKHITPFVYSNEQKFRFINKKKNFTFDFFNTYTEEGINSGIKLRILLIDDKISEINECKADLIKDLLEVSFVDVKDNELFRENVCRLTPKESRRNFVEVLRLFEIIINNKDPNDPLSSVYKITHLSPDKIQIIAVKNLSSARQLLECDYLKFDLIMMDYLLDRKNKETEDREYATEFWGNDVVRYFDFPSGEELKLKHNNEKKELDHYLLLKESYAKIISHRCPMNKLWIFPITAFNQTFIEDLRNKGVQLIDSYWNLSLGADPVNTPELFRYELFSFMKLMIEEATFNCSSIAKFFVQHKIKLIEGKEPENIRRWAQAHIGIYMLQLGRIAQLEDDAIGDGGSLFAKTFIKNYKEEKWVDYQIAEHLRDLLYNLAYGTVRERDTMLEDVAFLEGHKHLIDNEGDNSFSDSFDYIKKYILELPN